MDNIRIIPDTAYRGEGISQGLARGLLVYYGDLNLTGEGMGIGSVAIRDHECTYFSRSWTDSAESGALKRTFTFDTRMMWGIRGKMSGILTRWIEYGISAYMQLPRLQSSIMLPVLPLRNLLGIHPVFETIPSRGKVTFTYRVTGHNVDVHVESDMPFRPKDTLCLINELSAAWFTAGWDGKRTVSPPPGWENVGSDQLPVSLVDPVHGIRFFMGWPSVSPSVPHTVYRGREQSGDLCWAGFCLELGPLDGVQESLEARYCIGFSQGAFP
ncbi:MAG: hypothetical protein ABSE07_02060 [Methanoregula sp.]|jgi:hypothetical protein